MKLHSTSARRIVLAAAVTCAAALTGSAGAQGDSASKRLPAMAHVAADGLSRALAAGLIDEGTYALERARSLFRPRTVDARYPGTEPPDPHAATVVLRDLYLRLDQLQGAERTAAEQLLARPNSPGPGTPDDPHWSGAEAVASPQCDGEVCVHWTATGADAPDPTDTAPANGIPDYVDDAVAVLGNVWQQEVVQMGYRAPLADGGRDVSSELDVYLSDVGSEGLYGYCTSDDPNNDHDWDAWAFCVVDDDYAGFPLTPLQNLQVTAAHEFFHAVQFAYDFAEDRWLLEGTAAWIEDEVYDAVDDNRQYLSKSALRMPGVPIDRGNGLYQYGAWLWWRFLSETSAAGAADDPTIVRQVWVRADGSAGASDQYSLQAVKNTLNSRGRKLQGALADFAAWNRIPDLRYSEGGAYTRSPTSANIVLGPSKTSTSGLRRLKHLAASTVTFTPGTQASPGGHLTVSVDLPDIVRTPAARVIVVTTGGVATIKPIALGTHGAGSLRVAFGRGTIARIDLVLANGGSRFNCWKAPPTVFSCQGVSLDDNRTFNFRARIS